MTDQARTAESDCWCVYGTCGGGIENYGIEVTTPGCPAHDPDGEVDDGGRYDADDAEEFNEDQDSGEWREGECDHCYGETVNGPLGPIYCACAIGQGADPDECVCGPRRPTD